MCVDCVVFGLLCCLVLRVVYVMFIYTQLTLVLGLGFFGERDKGEGRLHS